MWILISPFFIKYFTPKKVSGVSIFPFIILEKESIKNDKTFVNHEMIHIYQQVELLFIFFVLFYYIEYFILLLKYKDTHKAYLNISFEREAYQNESNYNYLKTRRWFSFIKYW
jgi:cytochrome bd-type quinol oxidase subunit 2